RRVRAAARAAGWQRPSALPFRLAGTPCAMRNVAIVFILSLVVTACGDTQTPTSAARSDDPDITGAVNAAAAVMADSGADLQPGQSVQGLIEADIGKG